MSNTTTDRTELLLEIFAVADELYGSSDELLHEICTANEALIRGRLKEGVSIDDIRGLFITAVASMSCNTLLSVKDGKGDVASYKAGSVSVNFKNRNASVCDAVELLRPYIVDDAVLFTGVDY